MREQLRKSGIDIIGDVPWGTHICQFYQTKEDLIEILITYFKAGLENNEFCLWVTSQPVEVKDAEEALSRAIPDFSTYLEKGQIEIVPYTDWFIPEGVFDSKRVTSRRFEKLNYALKHGYDGMRLSGNTTWLEKENWSSFIEFKEQTDKSMDTYRMINLCTYLLDRHNAAEIMDVVVNHQFALIKSEGIWKRIDSPKRKQAEEAALQATKNWEYTFDAVPDLISIFDTEYRIIRANKAMAARLGVTPEECVGLTCYRVIHGMDEPPSYCPNRQMLKDGLEHTREVREDNLGGDFIVSVSPLFNSEGKVTGCIHIARDITERKQTEKALSASEELLRFALETSHTGAWDLDLVDHTAFRSLEHDRIFGYEQLLPQWTYEMFIDHVLPEDRAMVDAKFREATNSRRDWNFECRIQRVDGEIRWIWAAGRHRFDASGNMRRMAGIVQDITERKQLEEQTRQRAEEIETIMEVAPVGIWIGHDPECHTITGNKMANELYEAEAGENVSANVTPARCFFREGCELTADELPMQGAALKDIDVRNAELDVLLPSREWRALLGSASPLHDTEGNVRGSVGAFIDITERKKAEVKLKETLDNLENLVQQRTAELEKAYISLKESEKGLAEAQKMAHIGNWEWDIVTSQAHWSDEIFRIFQRSPQEPAPLYNEYLNYVHPEDRDYVADAFLKAINGKPYNIEHRIILANGEEHTVHKQSEVIFDKENNPVRLKGIIQDITERKKAEKALELSEERYRIITEQTGQLLYDYNPGKDITDWAGRIEDLTGFTPDEFRNMSLKSWLSRIHPEDLDMYLGKYERYLKSGDTYRTEYRFRKKNEEYIYLEDNGICLRDKKNNVHRILGVIKDITERKKAEIFLANIEIARKKEIHHRIKNNLQVISSLLDLQAEKFNNREYIKDSEVLKAFRESQERVMSIALIHEELHEGSGNDKLNFSPYLERLVKNLFQTYRLENINTSLNIELENDIFFDMDIAVPLGIIINELVSNALKYAFPGKDKGEIEIKLFREKSMECVNNGEYANIEEYVNNGKHARNRESANNESESKPEINSNDFVLKVSDNGVGIPENFSSDKPENLGLQLVEILVEQLGGSLELKRDSGTEFVIKFRVTEKR